MKHPLDELIAPMSDEERADYRLYGTVLFQFVDGKRVHVPIKDCYYDMKENRE